LTVNGRVSIATARIQGVEGQQMTADVARHDDKLTSQQRGRLYAGSYQSALQTDFAQPTPPTTLHAQLRDVDVGQVIAGLVPTHHAISGKLDSDWQLAGRGLTWAQFRHTLTGDGTLRISEAQMTAFDLMPQLVPVLRDVGALAGLTVPAEWEHTTFETLDGPLHLRQGKIFSEALKLRGGGIEAVLKGYIGLDQSLDYTGTAFLPAKLVGERNPLGLLPRDEHGRLIFPFAVQGTLQAPHVTIDRRSLQESVGEALLDQVKQQLSGTASGERQPPSEHPGDAAGKRPKWQDLPRRILRDLLQR
jgi:hypothetical protein